MKALKQRFDPESKKQLYVAELHTRSRRSDEDWASYGDALRVLADKAYGDLEEKARERLALTQFLSRIENPQVAFGVRQRRPETLEAAVVSTIELESYLGNCSGTPSRLGTQVASTVSSTGADSIAEVLESLNGRLDKLEVLMVSNASASARAEPRQSSRGREEMEERGPICWYCGKRGHIARKCWSRKKQSGNFNPSEARANHEGKDL